MIIPKLAFRNLIGNRAKTWLNALVTLVFLRGHHPGPKPVRGNGPGNVQGHHRPGGRRRQGSRRHMPRTTRRRSTTRRRRSGRFGRRGGSRPGRPVLIVSATIYPKGRMFPALLKGVDPDQAVLKLPSTAFSAATAKSPA